MSNVFIFAIINLILVVVCAQAYEVNYNNYGEFNNTKKYCRHRQTIYVENDFYKWAGYSCYDYSNKLMFKNGSFIRAKSIMGEEVKVPYAQEMDGTNIRSFYFTYNDEFAVKVIKNSFKDYKYYMKWENCVKESEKCCRNVMNNDNIQEDESRCPVIWDGWTCFNEGILGENTISYCPNYSYMTDPPCIQNSYKFCNTNSTWTDITDYTTCPYTKVIRSRHEFHVTALYVSIAVCVPAIIIFFSYRELRITRIILHRNLLIAIVLKNIFVILSKVLITLDAMQSNSEENQTSGTVLSENSVGCRVLAFFERASINAMYACMLVDGFYLHKIIVTVFRKDPPMVWLYSTVAILSLVPILIWATIKATLNNTYCWVVDDAWYQWIIDGSRYGMLGVNLILLLDILRVLIWKLKKNTGLQHTKATLRATFILLPLFGIQFIMMSQRPVNAPCFWDNVFYYVSYTMDSLQGILVSLLYCYFNKDVQNQIRKTIYSIITRFNITDNQTSRINARRSTAATYVAQGNMPRRSLFPSKNLEPVAENNQELKVQNWLENNANHN